MLKRKLLKLDKSLAVIIPKDWLPILKWDEDKEVSLSLENNTVVITQSGSSKAKK